MKLEWQRLGQLRGALKEISIELFENDGLNTVFLHARNILTGAAVFAAGLYAVNHMGPEQMHGTWTIHFAGYAVTCLGVVLLLLNLLDGLRRLAKREQHAWLKYAAIFFYLALSVRLTQVIIYFRAPV
jgi:hypothetical protein